MELCNILPIIKAIKENKSFSLDNNIANLVDYLIEADIEYLKEDLEMLNALNHHSIAQREDYITAHSGSYEFFDKLGVVAVIGDACSYLDILYNWKQNIVYVRHILIKSVSDGYPLPKFINLMTQWIQYAENNVLLPPDANIETLEGVESMLRFWGCHDANNPQVQERISYYTKQKNRLRIPMRIAAIEEMRQRRGSLLQREAFELSILEAYMAGTAVENLIETTQKAAIEPEFKNSLAKMLQGLL